MLRFVLHSGVLSFKKKRFFSFWFSFRENHWFPHCLLTIGSTIFLFHWTRYLLLSSVKLQVLNPSLPLHPNSMKFIHLTQSLLKPTLPQMYINRSGNLGDQRKPVLWHKLFCIFCMCRVTVRAGASFSELLLYSLCYVPLSLTRFQLLSNLVVSQTF